MSATGRGFGLVRRCRLDDKPMVITVGDVSVTITRLGTVTASVAVKAPPDITISFNEGHSLHETVEQAIESMIKGQH